LAIRLPLGAPAQKPSFADGVIRMLFVGRVVAAKGVTDLLAALQNFPAAAIRLDLVGNKSFSDPELIAELERQAKGSRGVAPHLHFDASDEIKQRLLQEADIFVLPSYHEGFCVPVVEALNSGCRIVTYDNSNLPAIGNGFSRLVATGDLKGLEAALAELAGELRGEAWRAQGYRDYATRAAAYAAQFDPATVDRRFVDYIEGWVSGG
jgi:glycosyltransferase involved in cell wall biosynthesis